MDTSAIDNPRLWRLTLGISPGAFDAVASSTVSDSTMQYMSVPLPIDEQNGHRKLEEAIYASPWLLGDFGKVDILFRTNDYTIIPNDFDNAGIEVCTDLTDVRGDAANNNDTIIDDCGCCRLVWALPGSTRQFIARTFRNAPLMHYISPLIRYFNQCANAGNRAKLYVHATEGATRRIDIFMFDNSGHLKVATSKEWNNDSDALYYIMAIAQLTGFDAENDELQLCGDSGLRQRLTSMLNRYVRHVLPLIFPSAALRAGREAFRAPFPLVILPLCE